MESRRQGMYWAFIAVQWLLLTLTLASAMIHTATAFQNYVSARLPDGVFMAIAFLVALLLGLVVRSFKVLTVLAVGMCLVAAAIFGAVIYLPAWQGILFRNVTLANYAQQQSLFMFLLALLPVLMGAVAGHLLGGGVHHRIDALLTRPEDRVAPWWERVENRDKVSGYRD